MNKEDKIKEGQTQLNNTDHYQSLDHPMVIETASKVTSLMEDLYDSQFIDETTMIISGCDGPTERMSAFVDKPIQPIAKIQKSYIKDTTDFINFIERKKLPQNTLLVTKDVTNLHTNIPQEQGRQIVCAAYDKFYKSNPPIPTRCLTHSRREILQIYK